MKRLLDLMIVVLFCGFCAESIAQELHPDILRLTRLGQVIDNPNLPLGVPRSSIVSCEVTNSAPELRLASSIYWRQHELLGRSYLWSVSATANGNCAVMHSPSVAVLSDAEFEILEGTSRALGAIPAALATEREGSPYQVQTGLSGTIAKLFRNRCQDVANAQSVGSAFFVRSNLAVTSGGNIGSTNPQLCVESGGRLFHVRSSFLNDPIAPALSIAFLDLSNNEALSFSTESTGQLSATQANATVQNRSGNATGLATANTSGPQYILINTPNAVSTFLSDKGGITLYPIGIGFPQPTSVKGVYVAGSSVNPQFLTSRFFSPFDGIRVTNHLPLLNPISISSPLSGATFYENQTIPATANQPVTWQLNGVAFFGNSFQASLLSIGRNVLTAVGSESESSIILNRSTVPATAFQPEPPASITLSSGSNFTTLNLRFYSIVPGLGNLKLLVRNLTLNEERVVAFTVDSSFSQGPTGIATINVLPGQYSLEIKSADGSQVIVQRDLQVIAAGAEAGMLNISVNNSPQNLVLYAVAPANVLLTGSATNTSGVNLTSQFGNQPETTIFTPSVESLNSFNFSRIYTANDFTLHRFRVRSRASGQILAQQSLTLMPKSKLSISPASGSWESTEENSCRDMPSSLIVNIFITNSASKTSIITNGNRTAEISGVDFPVYFGNYVGRLLKTGHGFPTSGTLRLCPSPLGSPCDTTPLPLNLRRESIIVNGQPMLRCSFNSNPQ